MPQDRSSKQESPAWVRVLPLIVVAAVFAACSRTAGGEPAFTQSDSSGILILQTVNITARPPIQPRLDLHPGLKGWLRTRPPDFARVVDVQPMGAAGFAVAEPDRILFFNWDGSQAWTLGSRGEGPGEFASIAGLVPRGDSIAAYDSRLSRVTVVAPGGTSRRTFRVPMPTPAPAFDGNQEHLVFRELRPPLVHPDSARIGLHRTVDAVVRIDWDGVVLDTVTLMAGMEYLIVNSQGVLADQRPFFGHDLFFSLGPASILVGDATSLGFQRYSSGAGQLEAIVRTDLGLELNPDLIAEERAARREVWGVDLERRAWEDGVVGPSVPAYNGMIASGDGFTWLRSHGGEYRQASGAPESWHVFDSDGQWVGLVETPANFRLTGVTDRWLVGVTRDELHRELPVVFESDHVERLMRGASSTPR